MHRWWCPVGVINNQFTSNHNSNICGVFDFNGIKVTHWNSNELWRMTFRAFQNCSSVGSYSVQNVFHRVMAKNRNYIPMHSWKGISIYRKIPNKPRGLYFSMALFEGLIFGGAYIRRGLSTEGNLRFKIDLPFLLCFTLYLRAIFQVQAPGGLYLEGQFNRGFFALPVWGGLYLEGLIFGVLR